MAQDPVRDARSKDPLVRLAAARALATVEGRDAGKALRKLLGDEDWEVACEASAALSGGAHPDSVDDLVDAACEGPVRRLRLAAARAAAALDPADAAATLEKRMKGDEAAAACEALALVVGTLADEAVPEAPRKLRKLLEDDDLLTRAAAGRARIALARADRSEVLRELVSSTGAATLAAALEQAATTPHPAQREGLEELLQEPELLDVLERRAVLALAACLADPTERGEAIGSLCQESNPSVAARGLLLAEAVASSSTEGLDRATAAARTHADSGVRALAAALLARLGEEPGLALAEELASDASPRVRRAARRAALELRPTTEEAGRAWALEQLGSAETPGERLDLVVALGDPTVGEDSAAVEALVAALADPAWQVAAGAAVSLGRTRSSRGVAALIEQAGGAEDWRLRGAAVVGLTKCLDRSALLPLASRVEDPEPCVGRTAHAYLTSLAGGERPEPTVAAWSAWLGENGKRLRLDDPKERRERRERYGYGAPPGEIYRGLDVVVLESRGDRMQEVLERQEIVHRETASSRVAADGLDAGGVFVSNCTGELEAGDVERLEWFLTVGGYLCGSCWALTETVGRVAPGYLDRLPTRDEVMDQVEAGPCTAESPYLEGVFGEAVVPVYHLVGAHLLRVLRPEAVEVLVDSPACAERWGGGTLAAWFRHGHGTVLVSANHFRAQGLEQVTGLSKPVERRAYALDHMGIGFEFLRETEGDKFWTSTPRAAAEVHDLSAFRLVTNFVRLRRLEGL